VGIDLLHQQVGPAAEEVILEPSDRNQVPLLIAPTARFMSEP